MIIELEIILRVNIYVQWRTIFWIHIGVKNADFAFLLYLHKWVNWSLENVVVDECQTHILAIFVKVNGAFGDVDKNADYASHGKLAECTFA